VCKQKERKSKEINKKLQPLILRSTVVFFDSRVALLLKKSNQKNFYVTSFPLLS
jgi:hypothetical protein